MSTDALVFVVTLLSFLIAEYIGDFYLQSREMALNKSKDIGTLFAHCTNIANCIYIAGIAMYMLSNSIALLITAILYPIVHGIQDWFLWRKFHVKVKKIHGDNAAVYYETKQYADDKLFYDFIGLDRLLHIITGVMILSVVYYWRA